MRLATIKLRGQEIAGIDISKGVMPISAINAYKGTAWQTELFPLICAGEVVGLTDWYNNGGEAELDKIPGIIPKEKVTYGPLYRNPKRIFGIGLNYKEHGHYAIYVNLGVYELKYKSRDKTAATGSLFKF